MSIAMNSTPQLKKGAARSPQIGWDFCRRIINSLHAEEESRVNERIEPVGLESLL